MRQKAIVACLIVCWCLAGLPQFRKNEVGADSPPFTQKSIASVSFDVRDVLGLPAPKLKMPTFVIPNHLGGFYPSFGRDLQHESTHGLETAHDGSKLHKRICVYLI